MEEIKLNNQSLKFILLMIYLCNVLFNNYQYILEISYISLYILNSNLLGKYKFHYFIAIDILTSLITINRPHTYIFYIFVKEFRIFNYFINDEGKRRFEK